MNLVPVKSVPCDLAYRNHRLQQLLDEFEELDTRTVEVIWDERDYKSADCCASCLHAAIKRSRRAIRVAKRGEHIYLLRE